VSVTLESQARAIRRRVELALIDRPSWARQIDPQTVRRLAASIQAYGLLQPVILVAKRDRFDCAAGNHRTEAERSLDHTGVDALILPEGTPLQDALACSLHENHVRADESLADSVRRLTTYQQYSGCGSRAGAARLAGFSESKASKTFYAVDHLSPKSLAFAAEHQVGVSVCYEIARRASDADEQLAWLQAHVRGQLPRDKIVSTPSRRSAKAASKPRPPRPKRLTVSGVVNSVCIRLVFAEQTSGGAVVEALSSVIERFRQHVRNDQPPATFSIGESAE
jgi:hypothetical protein